LRDLCETYTLQKYQTLFINKNYLNAASTDMYEIVIVRI